MNPGSCLHGRTLTLTVHEFDEITKAARERTTREPEAALKEGVEDSVKHYDAGL